MSRRLPLDTSTTISLDSSGNGTAKLGPQLPREKWFPNVASIFIGVSSFPVCRVYVGPAPTQAYIVDTSYLGAGDSTGRVSGYPVTNGIYVWAVWANGPANQQATLSIKGYKEVPG